jgi:hypothetical protein
MTENVTFFGQKNHILVVENLDENLKKKIKFSNFPKINLSHKYDRKCDFFRTKKSYFGG